MTVFHKIAKHGKNWLKSFKSDNKKQLIELEKLDKKIHTLSTQHEKSTKEVHIDNRSFLRFWLMWLLVVFLAYVSYQSLEILYLIIAAYIISLAIEAIIDFFQKRLKHRWISIFLSYLFAILFVLAAFVFIIPFLLNQLSAIISMFTWNIAHLQAVLETSSLSAIVNDIHWLPKIIKNTMIDVLGDPTTGSEIQTQLQENMNNIVNVGSMYAKEIGNFAVSIVGSFITFIAQISIVLTLSVMFSLQKTAVMKFISNIWGGRQYRFIYMRLEKTYKKLGIWLKSQLLLCLFIWWMMLLSLWILSLFGLDVPQKFSLALIAWLTELIPYFGPILWWAVAVIVAWTHVGFYAALIVVAIVILIQWIENNVLIPSLMNKTLWVNPVVIFLSMLIGSLVIGFVGVLLAVPIAVIITLFLDKNFEE